MNKELTTIAILLFAIIIGVKALDDPGFQASVEQTIEVEIQNLLSNMIGEETVFSNLNTQDLMKEFNVVKP